MFPCEWFFCLASSLMGVYSFYRLACNSQIKLSLSESGRHGRTTVAINCWWASCWSVFFWRTPWVRVPTRSPQAKKSCARSPCADLVSARTTCIWFPSADWFVLPVSTLNNLIRILWIWSGSLAKNFVRLTLDYFYQAFRWHRVVEYVGIRDRLPKY